MTISKIGLICRGMAMGVAEVIPGVSGGTIAFITGIYKTLIDTIKAVNKDLLTSIFRFRLKEVWTQLNGPFLFWLMCGMVLGILVGVFGVSHLLETYPEILWSLFFGLILASVPFMLSQIEQRQPINYIFLIIGAVIAFGITLIPPSMGSTSLLYVFVGGTIAISALVLPGISGSFILLLMGLYTTIIPTIKAFLKSPELDEFILLVVFGLGCLLGLMVFSRIVSAAFEKYHDFTLALLSGFMLGSLKKIWPWRNPTTILDKDTGRILDIEPNRIANIGEEVKILSEKAVLPSNYFTDPQTLLCLAAIIVGIALVGLLSRVNTAS